MKHRLLILTTVAALLSALVASSAAASTSFGRSCASDGALTGERTLIEFLRGGPGLPVAGVITAWKLNVSPTISDQTQRLKLLREGVVVGETEPEVIAAAYGSLPTRIPVRAGDQIGLSSQGPEGVVYDCGSTSPEDSVEFGSGDPPVGKAPGPGGIVPHYALPVTVTIEPDGDGDGYGDETQDACPLDPLAHTGCGPSPPAAPTPPAASPAPAAVGPLTIGSATVARKSALDVYVTASAATTAQVAAHVSLQKGKSTELTSVGGAVTPGALTKFTIPFPASLKKRLRELPPGRALIAVGAVTASGAQAASPLTAKLSGQAPGRH